MSNENTSPPTQAEDALWGRMKPNWETWQSVKTAQLWEAASLACDYDPSNFKIGGMPVIRFIGGLPKPIQELLDMAKGAIGAGSLTLANKSNDGIEEREVKLTHFATWLQLIGHQPPAEFPWLPETLPTGGYVWPWGRHETDLLRKLAAAADKFWKNYDPGEPSTAPTNQDVAGWLMKQGVAERNAKVMASILRPDGLPTGPRK